VAARRDAKPTEMIRTPGYIIADLVLVFCDRSAAQVQSEVREVDE
jgi:hypothetical protein